MHVVVSLSCPPTRRTRRRLLFACTPHGCTPVLLDPPFRYSPFCRQCLCVLSCRRASGSAQDGFYAGQRDTAERYYYDDPTRLPGGTGRTGGTVAAVLLERAHHSGTYSSYFSRLLRFFDYLASASDRHTEYVYTGNSSNFIQIPLRFNGS